MGGNLTLWERVQRRKQWHKTSEKDTMPFQQDEEKQLHRGGKKEGKETHGKKNNGLRQKGVNGDTK